MKCPETATVDFETFGIQHRPVYPPKPVGVAIHEPGKKPHYWAWGHPTGNNCTRTEAQRVLKGLWRNASRVPLLFHHQKFDLDVAETWLDCPLPPWHDAHDTLFLGFLNNPHAASHSLKPMAEELLGVKPTERDELRAWILRHIPEAKKKPSTWGAYIALAPGDLVGRYAVGDVTRTRKLFVYFWKRVINELSMAEAYDRERRLMPALLRNERRGIPCDTKRMEADLVTYEAALLKTDAYIRKQLGDKNLNVDSNEDLADAIEAADKDEGEWILTPKGNRSTSKDSIAAVVQDPKLIRSLRYRGALATCLSSFMRPWLVSAQAGKGFLYPDWNQVRQPGDRDKGNKGARTGRMSVSRFMNVPKEFLDIHDEPLQPPTKSLPNLPTMRDYLIPGKGLMWGKRDYTQQELRILAHFEDGGMLEMYKADPWIDFHDAVKAKLAEVTGVEWPRRDVKITNFGILYGMGAAKLAYKIQKTVNEARSLRKSIYRSYPGVKDLDDELKQMGRDGEPVVTWGGRRYFCEPSKIVKGVNRSFEYKLLNYLVQGSAADCTKEAIIRYDDVTKDRDRGRFVITVHDEINMVAPKKCFREEMDILRKAMESIEFEVLMLSDGSSSDFSWHRVEDWNDRRPK